MGSRCRLARAGSVEEGALDDTEADLRRDAPTNPGAGAGGRHGTEWIVPEDREQVKANMLAGCERPYEVVALRRDGSTFPCEIQARMPYDVGSPIRVAALRDINERKQAARERESLIDELQETRPEPRGSLRRPG